MIRNDTMSRKNLYIIAAHVVHELEGEDKDP